MIWGVVHCVTLLFYWHYIVGQRDPVAALNIGGACFEPLVGQLISSVMKCAELTDDVAVYVGHRPTKACCTFGLGQEALIIAHEDTDSWASLHISTRLLRFHPRSMRLFSRMVGRRTDYECTSR